jgi:uncharacterized glyoxalase superfamily protein PhnB
MPTLRYRDAKAAINWLCRAFGFARHLVVPGPGGSIAHAELSFGNGMVMLGSSRADAFAAVMRRPDEVGGQETAGIYVVVSDADAHHARARKAGATITVALHDEDHGGRGYGCRDLEGRSWYFGTFDPWAKPKATPKVKPTPKRR